MNFWDTSAIVPLILDESETTVVDRWYEENPNMVCWTLSPIEVSSAIYRKRREGDLGAEAFTESYNMIKKLFESVTFVRAIETVKRKADRLLALHPLRAADALQLAAALIAARDEPQSHTFLTFDRRLIEAAKKEGFRVNP